MACAMADAEGVGAYKPLSSSLMPISISIALFEPGLVSSVPLCLAEDVAGVDLAQNVFNGHSGTNHVQPLGDWSWRCGGDPSCWCGVLSKPLSSLVLANTGSGRKTMLTPIPKRPCRCDYGVTQLASSKEAAQPKGDLPHVVKGSGGSTPKKRAQSTPGSCWQDLLLRPARIAAVLVGGSTPRWHRPRSC